MTLARNNFNRIEAEISPPYIPDLGRRLYLPATMSVKGARIGLHAFSTLGLQNRLSYQVPLVSRI